MAQDKFEISEHALYEYALEAALHKLSAADISEKLENDFIPDKMWLFSEEKCTAIANEFIDRVQIEKEKMARHYGIEIKKPIPTYDALLQFSEKSPTANDDRELLLDALEKYIANKLGSFPYSLCVSGKEEEKFYTTKTTTSPLFFTDSPNPLDLANNLTESEKPGGP